MKKLLIDTVSSLQFQPGMLNESSYQENGRLVVPCILQKADEMNQNQRSYPKEVLVREANKYMKDFIKEGRGGGELDHPDTSVVSLRNASHRIIDLWWEGNTLKGKLEVSNTPNGHILENLLRDGWRVGISSRGLGSVKNVSEGNAEVQDDFELIAWDVVSNPSTYGAFLSAVNEGVDKENNDNNQKINELVGEILRYLS